MKTKTGKIIIICLLIILAIIFLPRLFPSLSGNYFTWVILLLCPLMHLFMMKGMNHGKDHSEHSNDDQKENSGDHSCCGKNETKNKS